MLLLKSVSQMDLKKAILKTVSTSLCPFIISIALSCLKYCALKANCIFLNIFGTKLFYGFFALKKLNAILRSGQGIHIFVAWIKIDLSTAKLDNNFYARGTDFNVWHQIWRGVKNRERFWNLPSGHRLPKPWFELKWKLHILGQKN